MDSWPCRPLAQIHTTLYVRRNNADIMPRRSCRAIAKCGRREAVTDIDRHAHGYELTRTRAHRRVDGVREDAAVLLCGRVRVCCVAFAVQYPGYRRAVVVQRRRHSAKYASHCHSAPQVGVHYVTRDCHIVWRIPLQVPVLGNRSGCVCTFFRSRKLCVSVGDAVSERSRRVAVNTYLHTDIS